MSTTLEQAWQGRERRAHARSLAMRVLAAVERACVIDYGTWYGATTPTREPLSLIATERALQLARELAK